MELMNGSRTRGRCSGPVLLTVLLAAVMVACGAMASEFEIGTEFTYQGDLQFGGAPAEGSYDFEFHLYDQAEGGTYLGLVARDQLPVVGGSFATRLDYGVDMFSRSEGWVEIHVRSVGVGNYTELSPRQRVSGSRGSACTVNGDLVVEGNLGVQRPLPNTPLHVAGGSDASPGGGGVVMIGEPNTQNIVMDTNEIMARNNLQASTLYLNHDGGDISLGGFLGAGGVTVPTAPIDTVDQEATVNGGGAIRIRGGLQSLLIDRDEIQVGGLGAPGVLKLNEQGGNVGIASTAPAAPLHVGVGGPDASPSGGGVLVLGPISGGNLAFDNNEIMARADGAPSALYLNREGGNVHVGGDLHIGLEIVKKSASEIVYVSVACSAGKQILGGGCFNNQDSNLEYSYPAGNGWSCGFEDEVHTITVWAICADVGAAQLINL